MDRYQMYGNDGWVDEEIEDNGEWVKYSDIPKIKAKAVREAKQSLVVTHNGCQTPSFANGLTYCFDEIGLQLDEIADKLEQDNET